MHQNHWEYRVPKLCFVSVSIGLTLNEDRTIDGYQNALCNHYYKSIKNKTANHDPD